MSRKLIWMIATGIVLGLIIILLVLLRNTIPVRNTRRIIGEKIFSTRYEHPLTWNEAIEIAKRDCEVTGLVEYREETLEYMRRLALDAGIDVGSAENFSFPPEIEQFRGWLVKGTSCFVLGISREHGSELFYRNKFGIVKSIPIVSVKMYEE